MEDNKKNITLIYNNIKKEMNSIPKNYEELKIAFQRLFEINQPPNNFKFYFIEESEEKDQIYIDENQEYFERHIKEILHNSNPEIYVISSLSLLNSSSNFSLNAIYTESVYNVDNNNPFENGENNNENNINNNENNINNNENNIEHNNDESNLDEKNKEQENNIDINKNNEEVNKKEEIESNSKKYILSNSSIKAEIKSNPYNEESLKKDLAKKDKEISDLKKKADNLIKANHKYQGKVNELEEKIKEKDKIINDIENRNIIKRK